MPSEVQASADLGLAKGQHRLTFRNPRGNKRYYVFYDTGFGTVGYEWSSNGTAWTNADIDVITSGSDSFDVKIRDDGGQLVVWIVGRGSNVIYYRQGTIADSDNTITWGAVKQTIKSAMSAILSGKHCIVIARTDNGRLVVAFTEDYTTMGKDYRQTKLIGSDGDGAAPTWSGETTLDDPSGNTNNQDKDEVWFGLESFSSSYPNRVLFCVRVPNSTSTTVYMVRGSNPIWNGTSFSDTGPQTIPGGSIHADSGKVLSCLIDEDDFAHILYYDGSAGALEATRADAAGVGVTWDIDSETIKANDVDACTLALDTGPATDEVYAFYHDVADTTDFHYKKADYNYEPGLGGWGSEQTITFASDMIALTSWNRDIESGLHIGIEDADTDVWYHEVDVSGAPAAGQPVMKRMQGVPTMPGSRDRIGGWN